MILRSIPCYAYKFAHNRMTATCSNVCQAVSTIKRHINCTKTKPQAQNIQNIVLLVFHNIHYFLLFCCQLLQRQIVRRGGREIGPYRIARSNVSLSYSRICQQFPIFTLNFKIPEIASSCTSSHINFRTFSGRLLPALFPRASGCVAYQLDFCQILLACYRIHDLSFFG